MLTALVVDDEKHIRQVLVNHVCWNDLGVGTVIEAENGLKAQKLALECKPDIILSDIRMPKMNGIELAENIQRRLPDCKFIFLTAYSDKEYLKSAIRLKVFDYLEKPINLNEVNETLHKVVAECQIIKNMLLNSNEMLGNKLCILLATNHTPDQILSIKHQYTPFELNNAFNYITAVMWLHKGTAEGVSLSELSNIQAYDELCEFLTPFKNNILFSFKDDEYIVFHFLLDYHFEFEAIQEFFESLNKAIYTKGLIVQKFSVGLGSVVTGYQNIFQSYIEAVIAQKKCFFSGNINYYKPDNSKPYIFDENIITKYSESLKNSRKDELILLIKKLSNDIRHYANTQIDYVRNIFVKLTLILVRFTEDRNISIFKHEYGSLLDKVSKAPTLSVLTDDLVTLIEKTMEIIETEHSRVDYVSRITAYIIENYSNVNLDIATIARNVYLTPNYLCLLFKKETNKTINKYLAEVRIEKAKELLIERNVKINLVASSVGYKDPKYFSRVFENIVGIKPKEYSERHRYE